MKKILILVAAINLATVTAQALYLELVGTRVSKVKSTKLKIKLVAANDSHIESTNEIDRACELIRAEIVKLTTNRSFHSRVDYLYLGSDSTGYNSVNALCVVEAPGVIVDSVVNDILIKTKEAFK